MRWGILLLLLFVQASSGDEDVAKFLFGKARRAYRAKKFDEAAQGFRRAIAEHAPYPDASYALGQALEKLNKPQEAIAAYQQCVDAGARDDAPRKWKILAARAGQAIGKLRRRYAALERINQEFIKRLMELGAKTAKSDPAWAREAFQTILKVDPGHIGARNRLKTFPKRESDGKKKDADPKPSGAWGKPLITPDDLSAWSPGEADEWSIDGKVITGDVEGPEHGKINWLDDQEFDGKFALRFRFRLKRDGRNRRTVGLFLGDGKDYWWGFLLEEDNEFAAVRVAHGKATVHKQRAVPGLDLKSWQTVRIEIRPIEAKVYLNGRFLFEVAVPRKQSFEGKIAFYLQNAKAEFKDLEIKR